MRRGRTVSNHPPNRDEDSIRVIRTFLFALLRKYAVVNPLIPPPKIAMCFFVFCILS